LPAQVHAEGSCFRRLTHKTPQQVSTLFGTITLPRMGYRADGEPVLFPLCRALGLVHNATPALVEPLKPTRAIELPPTVASS
jgi:hypothetical protein